MRRRRCGRGVACFAAGVLIVGVASSAGPPIQRIQLDGAERYDLRIDAALVSFGVARRADGRDRLFALTAPREDGSDEAADPAGGSSPCDGRGTHAPRTIWRIERTGDELQASPLHDDLPGDCASVVIGDPDASGDETLYVGCAGRLLRLGGSGEGQPTEAFSQDGLVGAWANVLFGRVRGSPRLLVVPTAGAVRFLAADDAGRFAAVGELDTPPQTSHRGSSLVVRTAGFSPVGEPDGAGTRSYFSAVERVDSRRLRTTLVRAGPQGVAAPLDAWAALPAAEHAISLSVLAFDGEPLLVAMTRPSDRLGLLGEARLRVFALREDRSRTGHPPLFATESRVNLWQNARAVASDVDSDERDDLVLIYWKGIKNDRIVLDVYRRRADGGFESAPRTTAFDVADAKRAWFDFTRDVDGDGSVDLQLLAASRLQVHRGTPNATTAVEQRPTWNVPLPAGRAFEGFTTLSVGTSAAAVVRSPASVPAPLTIDLDGDNRAEIVVPRVDEEGWLTLAIVRLDPP